MKTLFVYIREACVALNRNFGLILSTLLNTASVRDLYTLLLAVVKNYFYGTYVSKTSSYCTTKLAEYFTTKLIEANNVVLLT